MATISLQRLEEIRNMVQLGNIKIPQSGIISLPDSPSTGLSATGKIIEISTGQELGNLTTIPGTSNVSASFGTPTITGDDFKTEGELRIEQPITEQPADISKLEIPKFELTPTEKTESDINKRLQKLSEEIAGKPTFEAEKAKELGLESSRMAFEDLSRQLRDLQRQQQLVPLAIQKESEGRGRTVGGVEPLEIGKRRALAYDALTLASRIDAAQGLLASAERKVLEAVNQKFAPLEANQKALLTNLNLIRQSPESTIQEKNRALELETKIRNRQATIEKTKEEQKNILIEVNKASKALAERGEFTPEVNLELDKIIKTAKTEQEAISRLAPYLRKPITAGDIDTFKAFFPDVDITTPEGQQKYLDWKTKMKGPEKLTGDIGEFKQFFPGVDISTLEGRQKFLNWKAQVGEAGRKPEKLKGGIIGGKNVSQATLNTFEGFAPQTPTERSELQTDIVALGLNKEEPQKWFKEEAEKQLQASIIPERLKELWDEERQPILDLLEKSESGRTP